MRSQVSTAELFRAFSPSGALGSEIRCSAPVQIMLQSYYSASATARPCVAGTAEFVSRLKHWGPTKQLACFHGRTFSMNKPPRNPQETFSGTVPSFQTPLLVGTPRYWRAPTSSTSSGAGCIRRLKLSEPLKALERGSLIMYR